VLTTVASAEEAERLGRALVEERLAACATLLPAVSSIYRWKSQIECSAECMLLLKTASDRLPALEARVHELHSYQTPAILTWRGFMRACASRRESSRRAIPK
jgi:periplasmic divalent cation tolerance protein